MGYGSWMEKKAQRAMLKRAMEAAWTAANCIGMVYAPLTIAMEMGSASRADVEGLIDDWLRAWRNMRHLSDRNLKRNRAHYAVRPNEVLSPILMRFEEELESIHQAPELDASSMLARLKDVYTGTMHELAFEFSEWAESAGPLIDFDAAKYTDEAVRRAQKYWEPTVRELTKAMG